MSHKLNKSGLSAKKVHTKSGMRTYWVKAKDAAKSAGKRIASTARVAGQKVAQHKGKIAAAAILATAAALGARYAHKNAGKLAGAAAAGRMSWKATGGFNKIADATGRKDAKMSTLSRARHAISDAKIGAKLGQAFDVVRQDRRDPNVGDKKHGGGKKTWRNILSRDNNRPNVGD